MGLTNRITRSSVKHFMGDFMRSRPTASLEVLKLALKRHREWTQKKSDEEAIFQLLNAGPLVARRIAQKWNADNYTNYSAATRKLQLSHLATLTRAARNYGFIEWTLDHSQIVEPHVDKGAVGAPSEETVAAVECLKTGVRHDKSDRGVRDYVIILLMETLMLRRHEISRINLRDIDVRGATIRVSGNSGKVWILPLTNGVQKALKQWLEFRGKGNGTALFINLKGTAQKRLSADGIAGSLKRHFIHIFGDAPPIGPDDIRGTGLKKLAEFVFQNRINPTDALPLTRHSSIESLIRYMPRSKTPTDPGEILNRVHR